MLYITPKLSKRPSPPPPPFKFPHRTIGKIHGSKKGANNENVSLVRNQTILAVCFYNDWAISCALIGRELWSIRVQTLQNDLILAQFVFLFLTEKLQWKWMSKLSMLLKKNKQTNKSTTIFHGLFSTIDWRQNVHKTLQWKTRLGLVVPLEFWTIWCYFYGR